MTDVTSCPICESELFPSLTCTDHALTKESFLLKQCSICKLLITTPRPSDEELPRYYAFPEYISHSGKSTSTLTSTVYRLARVLTLKWKRSLIEKKVKPGQILDVGCGTGEFLLTMKKSGWKISGVEPSSTARIKAAKLTDEFIYSSISDVPEEKYNVITLWHVLEHLPDMTTVIPFLRQRLAQNGIICFAVPNHRSYDAQKYATHWAGYDVPRHLWHFTKTSMITLLEKNKLSLLQILPMKLDAYYVSYLSEQYQHPGQSLKNIFRAIISGLRSNSKANKELNHSSLIFIARVNQ